MDPEDFEKAEWASDDDCEKFYQQMMVEGAAMSVLGRDGLRRFVDPENYRRKPEPPQ